MSTDTRWRTALQSVRWYVREVSGETAYTRYLARHAASHPGEPAQDERTWWRERSDGRDGEPPQRCC